ncbi:MAG: GNAT family N-acetyltransferase [Gemmatimonadaceae bacterium]
MGSFNSPPRAKSEQVINLRRLPLLLVWRVPHSHHRLGRMVPFYLSEFLDIEFSLRCDALLALELQPTLEGDLLRLRPLRPEDWDDLYAVASDPLIWEQHPANDRYKEAVFREFFREAMESGGALVVIDVKDGRVIGSSRFHGYDEERSEIEIGWTFLARSHWGGVYNKEMKDLMLRHAFRFVQSVIFLIGPENFRSQKAVEKIGAVRVGSKTDDTGRESVVFQLTAPA